MSDLNRREWRSLKDAVAAASQGQPELGEWLDTVAAVHPFVAEAVEGIWCGQDGRVTQMLRGGRHQLVVGWHNGKVEYSYVS